jgi:Leucine-rich repeat (LRR) protein
MFFSTSNEQKIKKIITWVRSLKINISLNPEEVKNITRLDLSCKGIRKLPPEIYFLENLTELNLSNNNLNKLPKEFTSLANLRSLNLGYNLFNSIPDIVLQLSNIEVLNIEANLIKTIPSSISNLTNLSTLNLFANQISKVPEELCALRKLSRLNMALNQLSKLPASFENLTNIVELELWLNKFELIPDVVSKLPHLPDAYNSFDTDKLNKALVMAVFSNNLSLAEKLIFNGADVNYELEEFGSGLSTTPLFEVKSIEMIKFLLDKGANPHLKREIIKHVVSKNGEEEVRKTGKYETFLTGKFPIKIAKYIKSLNIPAPENNS